MTEKIETEEVLSNKDGKVFISQPIRKSIPKETLHQFLARLLVEDKNPQT
jgi:hypothetical protein